MDPVSSQYGNRPASPWTAPDTPSGDIDSSTARPSAPEFDPATLSRAPGPLRGSPVSRLAPRSVSQLLDAGFDIVRFRFAHVATLAAVILLPFVAIPAIASYLVDGSVGGFGGIGTALGDSSSSAPDTSGALASSGAVVASFVGPLLTMAAEMMMGVAIAHLVGSWLVGADPTPRDVLGVVRSRLGVASGAFVLALLAKLAGLMVCGIGLLYVVPLLSLLAPVVAVEGSGTSASLSRALQLGRRRWGALAGITVGWVVIWACITVAEQIAVAVVQSFLPGGRLVTVGELALSVLTMTFLRLISVAVSVAAYVDARVRTEGFDLALSMPRVFADEAV